MLDLKKKIDILFINPPSSDDNSQISFPINLIIMGSICKMNNINSKIIDLDFELKTGKLGKSIIQLKKKLIERIYLSDVKRIGFTTNCSNYPLVIELCNIIKNEIPEIVIFLGGPQASMSYKETLEKYNSIDCIIIGEAEKTLQELISVDFKLSQSITGIAYKKDDKVLFSGKRILVQDLDDLPKISYHLINIPDYIKEISKNEIPVFPIEAGRGCPFNCTFCCASKYWSRKYRTKSPKRLVHEMEYLKTNYDVNKINLVHDNLTFSTSFIAELSSEIIKRKLKVRWNCSSRIDQINEPLVRKLSSSGCTGVFMGIESGSHEMQKNIKKRLSLKDVGKKIKLLKKYKVEPTVSFILGFPKETEVTLNETMQLALECSINGAKIEMQTLSPLFSTEIYHEYKKQLFCTENKFSKLWYNFNNLDIRNDFLRYSDIYSFFYSIPQDTFGIEFLNYIAKYFSMVIGSMPSELENYTKSNKTSLLEISRNYFNKNREHNNKENYFFEIYKLIKTVRQSMVQL